MVNVLDIKKNKKLNIVLPRNFLLGRVDFTKHRCAVLIHLYYEETMKKFTAYINNVPEDIDIFFTYSDETIRNKMVQNFTSNKKNCFFIKKENRGRDISALLVAAREILLQYDYICFIHDKKEKNKIRKEDTEKWIYSLWENMLGSKKYIENVIYTLESRNNLGLLVPPNILSNKANHLYTNQWSTNYEIAVALSEELGLKSEIDNKKMPITLGSVFWAKMDALRKLLEKEWKYEDFDEEPLADDGTISHAIERIFAYVAQDAGYDTGWVMTDIFASEYIDVMQNALEKSFYALDEELGIKYVEELGYYKEERKRLMEFACNNEKTYIYGAGEYGISCYKLLKSVGIIPEGFVVTPKSNVSDSICNLPVQEIDKLELSEEDGIIVAVSYKYRNDIIEKIRSMNVIGKEKMTVFQRWKSVEEE